MAADKNQTQVLTFKRTNSNKYNTWITSFSNGQNVLRLQQEQKRCNAILFQKSSFSSFRQRDSLIKLSGAADAADNKNRINLFPLKANFWRYEKSPDEESPTGGKS